MREVFKIKLVGSNLANYNSRSAEIISFESIIREDYLANYVSDLDRILTPWY